MGLSNSAIVATVIAASFAAGLNVYATIATLGLLARYKLLALPAGLNMLDDWWVIGAAGLLFAVEFFADKVPAFDLIWNALHTFVRVPAAAYLGYASTMQMTPGQQAMTVMLAGVVALVAHGGKTAVRAAVTPSPEPLSNIGLSVAEDVLAIGLTWFAVTYPYWAAALALVMVLLTVLLMRWVWRALHRLFRGAQRSWNELEGAGREV
ncbi:MAG: DUF4126 domain-containing protein [Terriglobales bacterium]